MDATVEQPKKKWKLKMPGAFTILFFLTVISVFLTWFVPAGSYSKLTYGHNELTVTQPSGKKSKIGRAHV